jgi:hypothetical protein
VEVHAGGSLAGNESSDACSTASVEQASSTCTGSVDFTERVTPPVPARPETKRLNFWIAHANHDCARSVFDWMLMTIAPLADELRYRPKRSRKASKFILDRLAKQMPGLLFSKK